MSRIIFEDDDGFVVTEADILDMLPDEADDLLLKLGYKPDAHGCFTDAENQMLWDAAVDKDRGMIWLREEAEKGSASILSASSRAATEKPV